MQVVPGVLGHRVRIAIVRRPADRGKRPPVVVVKLVVEHVHVRIEDAHVQQCEQPVRLDEVQLLASHQVARQAVV